MKTLRIGWSPIKNQLFSTFLIGMMMEPGRIGTLGMSLLRIVSSQSRFRTQPLYVLINGTGSNFLKYKHGLCQGCPYSPYLFLLVMEGLSKAIMEAQRSNHIQVLQIRPYIHLNHMLFVDNVLLFCF
jgi:hypothetical protein